MLERRRLLDKVFEDAKYLLSELRERGWKTYGADPLRESIAKAEGAR